MMTPDECRENLISCKRRLTDALAIQGNEKIYWANMKAWFKQQISKEEFDIEARQMLTKETTHLHNEFLLAVLTKCHAVGSVTGVKDTSTTLSTKAKKNKRKMQAIKRKFDNRFVQAVPASLPPARNIQKENKQMLSRNKSMSKQKEIPKQIVFCSRSLEIPGMLEMNGRVAVITWEKGLDDFSDEVSQLVINAIYTILKNIIADICSRRSAYKVRSTDFRHHISCTPENPYLLQDAPIPSLFGSQKYNSSSLSSKPTYGRRRTDGNQNKRLIPSHSVYGLCMERLLSSLWHPDHDEIEQDHNFNKLVSTSEQMENHV
uniref:transcriptional adapter 1-like n=1 Tax=Styela clava TaxID=7725 RepID=UPI00193998AE|nr:transcriptional adapter 1-like [Styela clava]